MIYYDITDKENDGIYISFTEEDKAKDWIQKHKDEYEKINIFGLHIIENDRLTTYERCEKAFAIANNAIYFNDNSDYLSALYEVCKILDEDNEEEAIGKKYIEEQ